MYMTQVRAIVPLAAHGRSRAHVATFGAGYRPLVHRYAPAQVLYTPMTCCNVKMYNIIYVFFLKDIKNTKNENEKNILFI